MMQLYVLDPPNLHVNILSPPIFSPHYIFLRSGLYGKHCQSDKIADMCCTNLVNNDLLVVNQVPDDQIDSECLSECLNNSLHLCLTIA